MKLRETCKCGAVFECVDTDDNRFVRDACREDLVAFREAHKECRINGGLLFAREFISPAPKSPDLQRCAKCGTWFNKASKRKDAVYCSEACRSAAYRSRIRQNSGDDQSTPTNE